MVKIIEREIAGREDSLGKPLDDNKKSEALSKAAEYEREMDRMAEKIVDMMKDIDERLGYELKNRDSL